MDGHEPGTFVKNEHGNYIYSAGHSSLNLVPFFEFLLEDYINEPDECFKKAKQPTPDKQTYEVIKCECDHVAPVEFSTVDENGCWTCPDCQKDFLFEQIEKLNKKEE